MSDEILEVWLTRRALVAGVRKVQVRLSPLGSPFVVEAGANGRTLALGKDAHLKRAEALAAVERERDRRVRTLQDQIDRIRAINFGVEQA